MSVKKWAVSEEELSAALRSGTCAPDPWSPLSGLEVSPLGQGAKPPADPEFANAIEALAHPTMECGMLLSPPFELSLMWFFAAEGDGRALASHALVPSGGHAVAWTEEEELSKLFAACLLLDAPLDAPAASFTLSISDLQAFVGVLDAQREWTLESLLARTPTPDAPLAAETVFAALYKGRGSGDSRWHSELFHRLCPVPFEISLGECTAALERLTAFDLLTRRGEYWEITPKMRAIAAALSSPLAYAALHGCVHQGEAVTHEHFAAIRTPMGMWLLEFAGIGGDSPHAILRAATCEDVEVLFADSLLRWRRAGRRYVRTASATEQSASQAVVGGGIAAAAPGTRCDGCGHESPAGAQFCEGCGANLMAPAPACPRCSGTVRAGAAFCPACGQSLRSKPSTAQAARPSDPTPQHAVLAAAPVQPAPISPIAPTVPVEPVATLAPAAPLAPIAPVAPVAAVPGSAKRRCPNPACGKEVPPSKRFCTACGAKVD